MTPVDQRVLHDPERGLYGDCMTAVIASLLDLPYEAVPHFTQLSRNEPSEFWELLQKFLLTQGVQLLQVPAMAGSGFWGSEANIYHEIAGPSPRGSGVYHAVVGCNGHIVHDPHPSRAGLAGDPSEWTCSYLVKIGRTDDPPKP